MRPDLVRPNCHRADQARHGPTSTAPVRLQGGVATVRGVLCCRCALARSSRSDPRPGGHWFASRSLRARQRTSAARDGASGVLKTARRRLSTSENVGAMDCVFCRLIREDTTTWIARGPSTRALAPLAPLAPGHTLVIPTAHVVDLFEAEPGVLAQSMTLVRRVADAMRSALGATGVNILNASGPSSEQSVPHLHFHVVPRWSDDDFSTWPASRSRHRADGDPLARLISVFAAEPDTSGDTPADRSAPWAR